MSENREIIKNGLWSNNVALVQLLGLCPLLAVSSTAVNGFALGLATLLTLVMSNSIVSAIRNIVRPEVRLPVFVLVIAAIVTAIEFLVQAFFYDLYRILGIFLPLIVTNCSIIGRAEGFASRNRILPSALDGFMMGFGFLLVLTLLGMLREVVGAGTLFANAHLLLGAFGEHLEWVINADYEGFLLAILPPGAFFGLALLIVAKNLIDQRLRRKPAAAPLAKDAAALSS